MNAPEDFTALLDTAWHFPPALSDADIQRMANEYQRDAIAEAQATRPYEDTAEDLG